MVVVAFVAVIAEDCLWKSWQVCTCYLIPPNRCNITPLLINDGSSGSSSASSTSSSSSDDDVGNKVKVNKLHPVAHSQSSTNTDHTNIDPVPPLISDNTFIHPHPFFQHTHSSNKVHKFGDSSSTSSASINDHVTSKIKVHDSKDDTNYSNGPADNIIKDVENSLKQAGINIDLG